MALSPVPVCYWHKNQVWQQHLALTATITTASTATVGMTLNGTAWYSCRAFVIR